MDFWLLPGARHIEVSLDLQVQAQNHRCRMLFPTDIKSDDCFADSQFDIVKRRIQPWSGWTNPSDPQPQQAFVDVCDDERGLCIANRGLPCYEVLRDGRNTIALTILRAVDRLGDWGQFPTPGAQVEGVQAQFAIIPHAGHIMAPENRHVARTAWEFANPMWAAQAKHFAYPHKERWATDLPPVGAFVTLEPDWLPISAFKRCEARGSMILRTYNPFEQDVEARVGCMWPVKEAYLTNLAEERQEQLEVGEKGVELGIAAKKIITLELVV
jgi:alpha-mannosidase